MTERPLRVLVAGGGLSGLAAAIRLCQLAAEASNNGHKLDLSVTVFEKDPTANARIQGFRLAVSPRGAAALDAMGILEKVAEMDAVPQTLQAGHHFVLATADGTYLAGMCPDQSELKPHLNGEELRQRLLKGNWFVNRGILRTVMLEALDDAVNLSNSVEAQIMWGAQVAGLDLCKVSQQKERLDQAPVVVSLANGTRVEGDVLLGCDGIFSAVRQLLPDAVHRSIADASESGIKDECLQLVRNPPLRHLGVAWVRGWVEDRSQLQTLFSKGLQQGDVWSVAMGDTKGSALFAEWSHSPSRDEPAVTWFFAFRLDKDDASPSRTDSAERVAREVLMRMGDTREEVSPLYGGESWHPAAIQLIKETLQEQPDSLLFRHLYDRGIESYRKGAMPPGGPPLVSWDWVPVTLLGDAFHPVASYALTGGGSDAMADGDDVANEIVRALESKNQGKEHSSVVSMFRKYENSVRLRSMSASRRSGLLTPVIHSGWMTGRTARVLFAALRQTRAMKMCFGVVLVGLALKCLMGVTPTKRSIQQQP